MKVTRVLLAREAGGLGDVLMTLPAVKAYHDEGWQVDYLCLEGYAPVVHSCPYITNIYTAGKIPRRDRDAKITKAYLRQFGVDVDDPPARVIDLYCPAWKHESATAGLPWRNRIDCFLIASGYPKPVESNPLLNIIEPEMEQPGWLPLTWDYAVVQRHTMDIPRDVPLEIYQPHIEKLRAEGLKIISLGTRESDEWPVDKAVVNLPWPELFWTIANAKHLLCGDSGLLHLGAVWDVPTTAFFSVTNGRLACRQYTNAEAVQCQECAGAPCYYHRDRGWRDCRNRLDACKAWGM